LFVWLNCEYFSKIHRAHWEPILIYYHWNLFMIILVRSPWRSTGDKSGLCNLILCLFSVLLKFSNIVSYDNIIWYRYHMISYDIIWYHMIKFSNIISYHNVIWYVWYIYDIYMIYQPFEQLESLYFESKLITSKNFIGTYFGHMVTISDLWADPQRRPLPLVKSLFYKWNVKSHLQSSFDIIPWVYGKTFFKAEIFL